MYSTLAQGLIGLSSTLLGLSIVAIGLRFYTRRLQKLPLKADDWVTLPCLILFIGTIATTFYGINKEVIGYPTPKDLREAAETAAMTSKLYIAFDFFSITALGGIKISALLFFRRIFSANIWVIFNLLILLTVGIMAFWIAVFLILSASQCGTHFSALWTSALANEEYCRMSYAFLLSLTISDAIMDVWILSLPLYPLWTMQASFRRRFAVMGVFLLAFVGLLACVSRLVVFVQIKNAGRNVDGRLVNTKAIYLSILECGLNLVAVNLPTLWYLFGKAKGDKIPHNVRSLASLRIDQPLGKENIPFHLPPPGKGQSSSSPSQSHLAHPDAQFSQANAMRGMQFAEHDLPVPPDNIYRTGQVPQAADYV